MKREIVGFVRVQGVDDEVFGDDEQTDQVREVRVRTADPGAGVAFTVGAVKWGGECRVELVDLQAKCLPTGSVKVTGEGRLYEGATENSSDLDGRVRIDFEIPPTPTDQPTAALYVRTFRVSNDDEGGKDFADITFAFGNFPLKD
jgi:hypothetical protein